MTLQQILDSLAKIDSSLQNMDKSYNMILAHRLIIRAFLKLSDEK